MGSLKLILLKRKYFSITWVFASLNIMIDIGRSSVIKIEIEDHENVVGFVR